MDVKYVDIKNKVFTHAAKLVNILDFDPEKLIVEKEGDDEIGIYYISYGFDPFYLVVDGLDGYFECNSEGNKYLILVSNDKNQKMHDKYIKVWEEIKNIIDKISGDKISDYDKDYGMIRFYSDNDLPLDITVKILSLTVVIRSAFKNDKGI